MTSRGARISRDIFFPPDRGRRFQRRSEPPAPGASLDRRRTTFCVSRVRRVALRTALSSRDDGASRPPPPLARARARPRARPAHRRVRRRRRRRGHEVDPAEFERSLFATRGSCRKDPDVTPTPHLLKLYAPWCGHCARMAPAFDEAAAALRLRGMEVGKLDCADRARGGGRVLRPAQRPGLPAGEAVPRHRGRGGGLPRVGRRPLERGARLVRARWARREAAAVLPGGARPRVDGRGRFRGQSAVLRSRRGYGRGDGRL